MDQPIGPGDWVECTHCNPLAETPYNTSLAALTARCVYRVRQVGEGASGIAVLWLAGVESSHPNGGWNAARFRPVYRPDETLTERLMQPLPDLVEQVHA